MRAPCEALAYMFGCEAEPEGKEEEASVVERATCMSIYYVSGGCVGAAAAVVELGRGGSRGMKEAVRWTAEASWGPSRDGGCSMQLDSGEVCENCQ